jgi:serine/threonine-protein kinase
VTADPRWARIRDLFDRACDVPPPERAAWLDTHAGDAEMRAEVERLLAADAGPTAAWERLVDPSPPRLLVPGTRAGAWRVEGLIGEGGMGSVHVAARADGAFERSAALKVVRPDVVTPSALERFARERQLLASLEHPNIARLLDGGTLDDGRPFLVMELVQGEPIDRYCDRHRLSIDRRLRLFRQVCEAVHHAHTNLVVHRDLKPDNVLVAASGAPKLLDFGIATLLASGAGAARDATRALTPGFASPEQFAGGPVTTATDVYSLGAVLFLLLTGVRAAPPSSESVRSLPGADVGPRLASQAAVTPDGDAPSPAERAACRGATAEGLRRRLQGDLDTILAKAMHPAAERRYASVDQFAEDLRRHLAHEPVAARPDAITYRIGRTVRRHRTAVALATALLVALVAGGTAIWWQARQARMQAARAERTSSFLVDLLRSADPWQVRANVTVREVLDQAGRRVAAELEAQPALEAAVRQAIGQTYEGLGLLDQARPHLDRALALHVSTFGSASAEAAVSRLALGALAWSAGDLPSAERDTRAAAAALIASDGGSGPRVVAARTQLGSILLAAGNVDGADAEFTGALEELRRAGSGDTSEGARLLNQLALVRMERGDASGAEPLLRRAIELVTRLQGRDRPEVATALSNLAGALEHMERGDEAGPLFQESLEIRRRVLGDRHPGVVPAMYGYAYFLRDHGRPAEAADLARQALTLRGSVLPDTHPMVASLLQVLGLALGDQQRHEEAVGPLRESLELRRRALPAGAWPIASGESLLGDALVRAGRPVEAEALLVSGHQGLLAAQGPEHPRTRQAAERLARFYESVGRAADAAGVLATPARAQ